MSTYIEMQVRSNFGSRFFDRRSVINKLGKLNAAALRHIGLNIRKRARQSIRKAGKRKRVSQPGAPPRSHTGWLRRAIYAEYDDRKHAVVIGPKRVFGTAKKAEPLSGKKTVPQTLEVSGTVRFMVSPQERFFFAGPLPPEPPGGGTVFVKRRIAKRPYMRPALQKSVKAPELQAAWSRVRSSIGVKNV